MSQDIPIQIQISDSGLPRSARNDVPHAPSREATGDVGGQVLSNDGYSLSSSGKRWQLCAGDDRLVQVLCQRLGIPEIMARIMVCRGVGLERAEHFLKPTLKNSLPDPFHLKDMDQAVRRLIEALKGGESIMLFGDYDVDGATSTSLLYKTLTNLGATVAFYIPDRLTEGYGPNSKAMEAFHQQGVALVVTLDCGTTAFEPLAAAKKLGLDVIVIDHHVSESQLPETVALVNPNRLDETSPLKHLAAVGLAFVTAVALVSELRRQGFFKDRSEPDLMELLDLVALGTVCDVMPLEGLNRAYVSQGLKVMAGRRNVGLRALADVAGVDAMPTPYHLGFMIGPRINAAGRISTSNIGTRLLTTENPLEAQTLANQLHHLNAERQDLEKSALVAAKIQAEKQLTAKVLMVASANWHPGVVGIVAGRLKDAYYRPTFCLALDEEKGIAKGSGRSVRGFDLGRHVHKARQQDLILEGGGHAMAAGVSVALDRIPDFQTYLEACLMEDGVDLTPTAIFEGFLSLSGLTKDLCDHLAKLEPYGQSHPTPRFCFEGIRVAKVDIVGQDHLRLILSDPMAASSRIQAMAFRSVGTALGQILTNHKGLVDVLGTVQLDTWGSQERVKVMVEDGRIHGGQSFGLTG